MAGAVSEIHELGWSKDVPNAWLTSWTAGYITTLYELQLLFIVDL